MKEREYEKTATTRDAAAAKGAKGKSGDKAPGKENPHPTVVEEARRTAT